MRSSILCCMILFLLCSLFQVNLLHAADPAGAKKKMSVNIKSIPQSHPRLFIRQDTADIIRKNAESPLGAALAERILFDAEKVLKLPPVKRQLSFGQMLHTSCRISRKLLHLCVAYQLTRDKRFADRAIVEMENAAAYSDWNPQHFLDTAELTFAMAVGYDWLYDLMSEKQQKTIADAIIEKGLKASFEGKPNWINKTSNWNPVCHGGLTAGAIAVADLEPELSQKVIERALKNVPIALKACYYPKGAYPEGPDYWSYSTLFFSYLVAMLENAFQTDFGLCDYPGMKETGDFIQAMTAPSGQWFNYADCGTIRQISFEIAYLAHRFKRPDWFDQTEQKLFKKYTKQRPRMFAKPMVARTIPLVMLYLDFPVEEQNHAPLYYFSGNEAENPVSAHRSAHTPTAAWIGVKGGRPWSSHGHMDVGSFCFESQGKRWVFDLGFDSYGILEKKGINIWNYSQNSNRWNVFRYGKDSHNIIQINGKRQNIHLRSKFIHVSETQSVLDLTPSYKPSADKVIRTLSLLPHDGGMTCTDSLTGLKPGSEVTWQFCTKTRATLMEDGSILLESGKEKMKVHHNINAQWKIIADNEIRNKDLDSPNPGLKMLMFTVKAPASGKVEYKVTFEPVKSNHKSVSIPVKKP